MGLKLATAPNEEPISLAEAKAFLRVDASAENALITSLIIAARRFVEKNTGRALITQTWDLWLDCFPHKRKIGAAADSDFDGGVIEGPINYVKESVNFIEIPKSPLVSVTHLKTYDSSETEAVMSTDDYGVDVISEPGRLYLKFGKIWPAVILRPRNGINIRFVAGFGAASAVPDDIKQAMYLLIGHWFEHREAAITGSISQEVKLGALPLLAAYEMVRL